MRHPVDPVLIYIADGRGVEGDTLPTLVEFTASLSNPSSVPVTFSYSTPTNACLSVNDGCAYPVFDFIDSAGTVVFAPGETTKSFIVPIVPDEFPEPTQGFPVDLWAPVNAAFDPRNSGGWTSLVGYTLDWFLGVEEGHAVDGLSGMVWGYIADDDGANVPPNANFSYNCSGLSCNFTDTSTDSDGTIKAWFWDFGDGTGSSSQNPFHTYAAYGTYRVVLTVADNAGATATASEDLTLDSTPPTQPTGLTAKAFKGQKIKLSWNASTDNGSGLAGYRIERASNGSPFVVIATTTTASFTDSGLAKGTTYTYRVIACDKAGNCSQPSNTTSATAIQ